MFAPGGGKSPPATAQFNANKINQLPTTAGNPPAAGLTGKTAPPAAPKNRRPIARLL